MKKNWKEFGFEAQLRFILQNEPLQLTELDIKASWAMLERRIQIWEQKNTQQRSPPNHQQDNNMLGDHGQ